jgi:hypothetical protein
MSDEGERGSVFGGSGVPEGRCVQCVLCVLYGVWGWECVQVCGWGAARSAALAADRSGRGEAEGGISTTREPKIAPGSVAKAVRGECSPYSFRTSACFQPHHSAASPSITLVTFGRSSHYLQGGSLPIPAQHRLTAIDRGFRVIRPD